MKFSVQLTQDEMRDSVRVGVERQIENIMLGSRPVHGEKLEYGFHRHINGALAEKALAKHFNLNWSKGSIGDYDVGGIVDIRQTHWKHGKLLVHEIDKDDRFIWLATGLNGFYTFHGGIFARDAKNQKWWDNPSKWEKRYCYCVPQNELIFPKTGAVPT